SLCHHGSDFGWRFGDMDAVFPHNSHFSSCCVISSPDDSASVSHSSTGRRCLTGNETNNWLFITVFTDPSGSFTFMIASNFAYHNNSIRLGIFHQQLYSLFCRSIDDRIATDTNCCRNTQPCFRNLVGSFTGKGTWFGNDSYSFFFEDKAWHDSYFGFSRSNY